MERSRPKVGAVIVAAGSSERMNGIDKIFLDISGMTVLERTVSAFVASGMVSEIVIVVHGTKVELAREMAEKKIAKERGWRKVKAVCPGGERRQDSSFNGAMHLQDCSYIMVHDGARPFVPKWLITRGIENAVMYGAAVPGITPHDTVKVVYPGSGLVLRTLNRDNTAMVQTPQVFKRDILMDAYGKVSRKVTDESSMVEEAGHRVKVFMGDPDNIKITTKDDIERALFILARRTEATETAWKASPKQRHGTSRSR